MNNKIPGADHNNKNHNYHPFRRPKEQFWLIRWTLSTFSKCIGIIYACIEWYRLVPTMLINCTSMLYNGVQNVYKWYANVFKLYINVA